MRKKSDEKVEHSLMGKLIKKPAHLACAQIYSHCEKQAEGKKEEHIVRAALSRPYFVYSRKRNPESSYACVFVAVNKVGILWQPGGLVIEEGT